MIKQKVMVFTHTWMELSTKGNGRKINKMEKEGRHGLMVQCMKATTFKVKSKALECSSGRMDLSMRASFTITTLKVKASTVGLMGELSMVRGKAIKCMGLVFSLGQMAGNTKVST